MEKKTDTISAIILGMQDLTRVLWAFAALLAPWLVPIGSAVFFGWAMLSAALSLGVPSWLATAVGICVAIALETVNIGTAHSAMALSHNRKEHPGKFATAIVLMGFYVVLGIFATWTLPLDWQTHILAGALFLLTPVAIISQALTLDLATTTKRAEELHQAGLGLEAEDRDFQRQLELRQMELEHEREMEADRLEAERKAAINRNQWDAKARIAEASARSTAERPDERPMSAQWGSGRSSNRPSSDHRADWAGRWATIEHFRQDVSADGDLASALSDMSGADLARRARLPDSTARRWMSEIRPLLTGNGHN